jgi:hypothetical protein
MKVYIKAHHHLYSVDIASMWYSPSARRWHGCILDDCKPFTYTTHGGPMDSNEFAAIREEFIIDDVDAGDECPFCGVEMGQHRMGLVCPCPPKEVCEHKNKIVQTGGAFYFHDGEVIDKLEEILICTDCGKGFLKEG